MSERQRGDSITVGDITQAQGVAIGRGARAQVTGQLVAGEAAVDPAALQAALKDLYAALNQTDLPDDAKIVVQTAAGTAVVEGVKDGQAQPDVIVPSIQKVGERLKEAQVVVREGTALWQSVQALAPLLGPFVGGAREVAGWFGISLPV